MANVTLPSEHILLERTLSTDLLKRRNLWRGNELQVIMRAFKAGVPSQQRCVLKYDSDSYHSPQTCNQGKVSWRPWITFVSECPQVLVHPIFSANEFGHPSSASCFSTMNFAFVGSSLSVPIENWTFFSKNAKFGSQKSNIKNNTLGYNTAPGRAMKIKTFTTEHFKQATCTFPRGCENIWSTAHTTIWGLGKLSHFSVALQGEGFCSYRKELFPQLIISATQLSLKKNIRTILKRIYYLE